MFRKEVERAEVERVYKLGTTYVVIFHRLRTVLFANEYVFGNAPGVAAYLHNLTITNPEILPDDVKRTLEDESVKRARKEPKRVLPAELPFIALYQGGKTTFSMVMDKGANDIALAEAVVRGKLWAWWFDEGSLPWIVRNRTIVEEGPFKPKVKKAFHKVISAVCLLKLLGNRLD